MRCSFLWLTLLFMVAFSFYGILRTVESLFKNTCHKFFAKISFALLPSCRFNLHTYFGIFCQTTIIEMPLLIRKQKITCEKCGTQTTRYSIVRHNKSCSAGTLHGTHCSNFSTKAQYDLKCHFAKKQSAPKLDVTLKCKLCYQ